MRVLDTSNVNVVFARIDNRLVHGQVGMVWANLSGANLLLVVDDEAAADKTQQSLMKMTISTTGIGIRFWTLEQTLANIWKAKPSQKIFIVTKTPTEMNALVQAGVPIKKVNLGNMHSGPGKRRLVGKYIYVDDEDMKNINEIRDKDVEVYAQVIPDNKAMSIENL